MNRESLAVAAARWTHTGKLIAISMLLTQAACSSETGSEPGESPAPTSTAVRRSGGVSEFVVEGVSIFTGPPNGEQALLSGVPQIQGDCLTVQGHLVVWSGNRLAEVESIVHTLLAGDTPPTISTGGGETDLVPDLIAERCSTDRVFLSGLE